MTRRSTPSLLAGLLGSPAAWLAWAVRTILRPPPEAP